MALCTISRTLIHCSVAQNDQNRDVLCGDDCTWLTQSETFDFNLQLQTCYCLLRYKQVYLLQVNKINKTHVNWHNTLKYSTFFRQQHLFYLWTVVKIVWLGLESARKLFWQVDIYGKPQDFIGLMSSCKYSCFEMRPTEIQSIMHDSSVHYFSELNTTVFRVSSAWHMFCLWRNSVIYETHSCLAPTIFSVQNAKARGLNMRN